MTCARARRPSFTVALLAFIAAGCGRTDAPPLSTDTAYPELGDVITALAVEERRGIRHAYSEAMIESGIPIPGDLSRGAMVPTEIQASTALDNVRKSQVVLIGDNHSVPVIGERASLLLTQVKSTGPKRQRTALVFELLPEATQERLTTAMVALAGGNDRSLREVLAYYIPHPLTGYITLLAKCALEGVEVIAVGVEDFGHEVVPVDVPDEERSIGAPGAKWVGPLPTVGTDVRVARANAVAVERIRKLLFGPAPYGQVWAIFGAAHLYGSSGIVTKAKEEGWILTTLFPVAPLIEEYLWKQDGWRALSKWYVIGESTLRSPSVNAQEYRRMGRTLAK